MSAALAVESATLPDGWYWTTMGEIAEVLGGGTPRTTDPANFEGGDVPWITPADLSGYTEKYISHGARFITRKGLESSSAQLLPAGTVLFTSRAPIGYVAIARNPLGTNQGFKSFVLKDGVLPEYVYWWLKGSKQRAEALASGTTFLELSGANAKKLPIPVAPLDEQRRIVAEIEKQLSRIDEAVANLKRVKANIKRYRAAVLKAAAEGRLVATEAELARRKGRTFETGGELLTRLLERRGSLWKGRGKYAEPCPPDTAELPPLPEGWTYATAEQLSDANRTITYGVIKLGPAVDGGVPVLRSSDVRSLRVNLGDVKAIAPRIAAVYRRTFLEGGEVIITVRGTLGGIAIAPSACRGFNVSREVAVIAMVEPELAHAMAQFIAAAPTQKWLMTRTKGIAYTGINIETLKALPLPVPPLQEQKRIRAETERRLSLVDELELEVESKLLRAQGLRLVTLELALRGGM